MVHTKILKDISKYANEFLEVVFPRRVNIEKIGSELGEHFEVIKYVLRRFFVVIAATYIVAGIFLGVHVLDSLMFGFIIFMYSNFLPDIDSLFKKFHADEKSMFYKGYVRISRKGRLMFSNNEAKWYEKYALLFFAPVFVYYRIFKKAKQLYTTQEKPFHNLRSLCTYSLFLLFVGFVLYSNVLEQLSVSLFGTIGYYVHLLIDKNLKWR